MRLPTLILLIASLSTIAILGCKQREGQSDGFKIVQLESVEGEPIKVDAYKNGTIVIDGEVTNMQDLKSRIPEWKEAQKRVSLYQETESLGNELEWIMGAQKILGSKIMFTIREEQQK